MNETLKDQIVSEMLNTEYTYMSDVYKTQDLMQHFADSGVDITSEDFKSSWVAAHNKVEEISWGKTGDQMTFEDFTGVEKEALANVSAGLSDGF